MKIACQTIVYKNPLIKDNIEKILINVKQNGYDGAEIGARHFYMEKPEYYKELFLKLDLALAALHVGGDFLNRDSVQTQLDNIAKTIDFAKKLDCAYIYLSGTFAEHKTIDDYKHEAQTYTKIGKMCVDAGKILCYHNHDWEFKNNMIGMNILLNEIPDTVMRLVPDVGWIHMGGLNPKKFLSDNKARVEAIHFKDFKGPRQFTELGTGLVNFPDVFEFIKEHYTDIWITAEQDEATHTPEESSVRNIRYIQWVMGV